MQNSCQLVSAMGDLLTSHGALVLSGSPDDATGGGALGYEHASPAVLSKVQWSPCG